MGKQKDEPWIGDAGRGKRVEDIIGITNFRYNYVECGAITYRREFLVRGEILIRNLPIYI